MPQMPSPKMSELFDKQVNAKKRKTYGVHTHKLLQAHKKVCDENERKKQRRKNDVHKNVVDGRREFIGRMWKSSIIDSKELQVDDC